MNAHKIVYDLEDIGLVVSEIERRMATCHVFAITGPLGAGKTTVIQMVLRDYGVEGPITSPTFTYVNEYSNNKGEFFYHFDLYRIDDIHSFQEMGFDEYLHQPNSWVFIEWPEVIKPLLAEQKVCNISFDYHPEQNKRVVIFEGE